MLQSAAPKARRPATPSVSPEASCDASSPGAHSRTTPQPRPDSSLPPGPPPSEASWAAREFGGATLKDARRVRSLQRIAAALAEYPHRSLTAACGSARRQAAHRLFEHPKTTIDALLAGHYARTAERCRDLPLVLVAQDTCFFVYRQAQIVGLAQVNQSQKSRALVAHGALALTPGGTPLGIVALDCWGEDLTAPPRRPGTRLPVEERESQKWREAFEAVARRLPQAGRVLVVADREADIGYYLTLPRPPGVHHLVRVAQNRVVTAPGDTGLAERQQLFTAVAAAPVLGLHAVSVPRRKSATQQIMLPAREATVEIRMQAIGLRPSGKDGVHTEAWVIQARELDPPEGEPPLHWVLITTEPVPGFPGACLMVGYYARRWVIERLHFTLKSGLGVERLQIDDAESLKPCAGGVLCRRLAAPPPNLPGAGAAGRPRGRRVRSGRVDGAGGSDAAGGGDPRRRDPGAGRARGLAAVSDGAAARGEVAVGGLDHAARDGSGLPARPRTRQPEL